MKISLDGTQLSTYHALPTARSVSKTTRCVLKFHADNGTFCERVRHYQGCTHLSWCDTCMEVRVLQYMEAHGRYMYVGGVRSAI